MTMTMMRCSGRNGYIICGGKRFETEDWMVGETDRTIKARVEEEVLKEWGIQGLAVFHGMSWEAWSVHQNQVADFMKKHSFPRDTGLCGGEREDDVLLESFAGECDYVQRLMRERVEHDPRIRRAQLLVEEVGELMHALRYRDREKVADAIGDIEYVLLGLAETFGINSEKVFARVHASNMSKDVGGHKPTGGHKPELGDV